MKCKYFLIAAIGFVIGWNVFLIQRDRQLFESYNRCLYVEKCQK